MIADLTFHLLSAARQLLRHTQTRGVRKPRWPLSTRRTRSLQIQSYDNGSTTETTRTIPWLNRAVNLSKAEGSKADIRSLSSSRVEETGEEGGSSSLTDSISLPLLPCVSPDFLFNPALPCIHPTLSVHCPALFRYTALALPALDHLFSLSPHSSSTYNISVCSFPVSERPLAVLLMAALNGYEFNQRPRTCARSKNVGGSTHVQSQGD